MRWARGEAGLRVDRVLALDPVEQVEVAHLVAVGGADHDRLVLVVDLLMEGS